MHYHACRPKALYSGSSVKGGSTTYLERANKFAMWPFKRKLTADQFAAELWSLVMRRAQPDFYKQFESDITKFSQIQLDTNEQNTLRAEMLLAHLWIISKTLGPDRLVLDALHAQYFGFERSCAESVASKLNPSKKAFKGLKELETQTDYTPDEIQRIRLETIKQFEENDKSELAERYETYYKAWEADEAHHRSKGEAGTRLSFEMLHKFLPHRDPLNFMLQSSIQLYIYSFIKCLCAIRKDLHIVTR